MATYFVNILSVKKMMGVLDGKTVICPLVRLNVTFNETDLYFVTSSGNAFRFEGTAIATGRANQEFVSPLQLQTRYFFESSYGNNGLGVSIDYYSGNRECRLSWFVGNSELFDTSAGETYDGGGRTLAATLIIYEDNAGKYRAVPGFIDSTNVSGTLSLTDATADSFGFYSVPAQTAIPFGVGVYFGYSGKAQYSPYIPAALIQTNDLAYSKITLNPWAYIYDGTAKTPAATVTLFGTTLTQGTDYTVTYSDNVDLGTATATVTGIGEYQGTNTAHFYIHLHYNDADTFLQGVAVGMQLKGWGIAPAQ